MSSADQLKLLLGLPEDSYGPNSVDTLTLMKAANVLEDCGKRLRVVTGNLGMTGVSAEDAIEHFRLLSHTTFKHVDFLTAAIRAADTAHIALGTARDGLVGLPSTEIGVGEHVLVGGLSSLGGPLAPALDVAGEKLLGAKKAQDHEDAATVVLTKLNNAMATAQGDLPGTGTGAFYTKTVTKADTPAPVPPSLNPSVTDSSTGGHTSPVGGHYTPSHSAGGVSEGSGAGSYAGSSGTGTQAGASGAGTYAGAGHTYGAASADGSMAGIVPGTHTSGLDSSGLGSSSGGGGIGGIGGGALAGGLAIGGGALGATALGRAGGFGAGGMGGIGSSIGASAGAGSRGGMSGSAGSRGSGTSSNGFGSAKGTGTGSQAGGAKGGMAMGGGGGGCGTGKEKGRRSGAGYLVPKFDIADDQAAPDLGAGAKAGSRAKLAAAPPVLPASTFEPDETW